MHSHLTSPVTKHARGATRAPISLGNSLGKPLKPNAPLGERKPLAEPADLLRIRHPVLSAFQTEPASAGGAQLQDQASLFGVDPRSRPSWGWDRATLYAAGLLLGQLNVADDGLWSCGGDCGAGGLATLDGRGPGNARRAGPAGPDGGEAAAWRVAAAVDTRYELRLVLLVHAFLRPDATYESISGG